MGGGGGNYSPTLHIPGSALDVVLFTVNDFLPGRLNMSNILLVMMKPPVMLIDEINVAPAANVVAVLLGNIPPPIITRPPAAVIPEMAFVTDIRGE